MNARKENVCTLVAILLASTAYAGAGTWASGAPLPSARQGAAAAVIGGKIYVVGGYDCSKPLSNVEIYDPATNRWESGPAMAQARATHSCGVIGGKLYVVGGYSGDRVLNSLAIFDPATNTWSTGPSMPTPRCNVSAAVLGDKLYVVGGMPGGGPVRYDILEVFDPIENKWTTGPPMPSARAGLATAVIGNRLYVIGGERDSERGYHYLDLLEIFDPETNMWTAGPPLPTPRFSLGATVVDGKLYTLGGGCGFEDSSCQQVMEVYDPVTGTWVAGPFLPTGRCDFAVATCGGKIYVMGGYAVPGCMDTVEIFDPRDSQCGGSGR
ncbi:MAG TPA: kelch repeat-containing protein [Candidatus Latescibacteria bacterium]|nr:kelch repeat-containing protein [Candidatus Latescibacterota bacterium]